MPRISELSTTTAPSESAAFLVADVGQSKKITLSGLRSQMVKPATASVLGGIKVGAGLTIDGNGVLSAESQQVNLSVVDQSIIPAADTFYDLGSSDYRFKDLWLSGSTLHLGTASISTDNAGNIAFSGAVKTAVDTIGVSAIRQVIGPVQTTGADGFLEPVDGLTVLTLYKEPDEGSIFTIEINNVALAPNEFTRVGTTVTLASPVPALAYVAMFEDSFGGCTFAPNLQSLTGKWGPFLSGAYVYESLSSTKPASFTVQLDQDNYATGITITSPGGDYTLGGGEVFSIYPIDLSQEPVIPVWGYVYFYGVTTIPDGPHVASYTIGSQTVNLSYTVTTMANPTLNANKFATVTAVTMSSGIGFPAGTTIPVGLWISEADPTTILENFPGGNTGNAVIGFYTNTDGGNPGTTITGNVSVATDVVELIPTDINQLADSQNLLFSGNYNDLTNKPVIPTVPTNVSAFFNDANYLTSNAGSITVDGILLNTNGAITFPDATTQTTAYDPNNLVFDNLTIQNDFIVGGAVSATQFTSTGVGVPTLTSSTNLNLTAANAVVITSSPLRLRSFTTSERDAFTPANGDLIYNTTTGKVQNYVSGAWRHVDDTGDLTISTNTGVLNLTSAVDGTQALQVNATNGITFNTTSITTGAQVKAGLVKSTVSEPDLSTGNAVILASALTGVISVNPPTNRDISIPDAGSSVAGVRLLFRNRSSTYTVTVKDATGNAIVGIGATSTAEIACDGYDWFLV